MKVLWILLTCTVRSSLQFLQDTSGVFSNENNFLKFSGEPSRSFQGRSNTQENEISRGPAINQDPTISPYWADSQGRPPNNVPVIPVDTFLPEADTCNLPRAGCNATYPYRIMSGYCNNLLQPEYGNANQPMPRILPPTYNEGLMRTRSVTGALLPNPRKVSFGVRNVPPRKSTNYNTMVMQIGQFVDHDFTETLMIHDHEGKRKDCLDCSSWRDPACAPIPVPHDDPVIPSWRYQTGQPKCLPFTRSTARGGLDSFGQLTLDQLNRNSAFLDLSTVYGSNECREKDLRSFSSGQLIEILQPKSFLKGLPPLVDAEQFLDCRSKERKCFRVGDDRNNEHIGILTIHMLHLREHNRLAIKLHKLNPHWDDERLFQEARRINIAQYQHMVYSEFLPTLVGGQKMSDYRLHPEKIGYYRGYNDRTNPGVLNEFSTCAFRVGHTLVPGDLHLLDKNFLPLTSVSLVQSFHNISIAFLPGSCDAILRGLIGTRISGVDLKLDEAITDRLFEMVGKPHSGEDLFARNIARGRDHGIAPYTMYKAACGGGVVATFDDLRRVMSQSAVNAIQSVYTNVEDIDLFVGGLAEDPVPGGLVGPTFACIIAYQFLNARRGDRFWYENQAAGFTTAQLHTIRSAASLSRVLCDNMDHEVENTCSTSKVNNALIPLKIFTIPSHIDNPLWRCDRIPEVDLSLWIEKPVQEPIPCTYLGVVYQWLKFVNVSPCLTCLCQTDGLLKCEPNLSGCHLPNPDEHCMLVCDESQPISSSRQWG